ncbi:MAG: hypothetical protein ACLUW6_02250 [Coriobacteriaceae bacterium]
MRARGPRPGDHRLFDDNLLAEPYGADDMAVIVAGDSPRIGEQAAHIRGAGIPVMVATTAPVPWP